MLRVMTTLCVAAAVMACASTASAAVLAGWDFTAGATATVEDGQVTASTINYNGTDPAPAGRFNGSVDSDIEANEAAVKEPGSGGYYEFTVTADAGMLLDLERFSYTMQIERWGSGRTHNMTATVNGLAATMDVYSLAPGDFDSPGVPDLDDVTTYGLGQGGNGGVGRFDTGAVIIDLSGLADAASVTIRVTGARAGGLSAESSIDNFELVGDVVVPEPASLALLGLGGLAMLRRRG